MTQDFRRKARKLAKLLWNPVLRRGLRHRVAAAIEHMPAMQSISFRSAVDVGANVGQFALLLRAVAPAAVIHSIEPLPGPAATFSRLFNADKRTTLHRIAAGSAAGEAEIHVSGKADSSSLLRITPAQSHFFPGTAEVGRAVVQVKRADDVIRAEDLPQPLLIKLDVQGFELAALQGMPNLLRRADHVYAEISFVEFYEGQAMAHELIRWLDREGFVLAGIFNPSFSDQGLTIQADALFSRARG